MTVGEQTVNLMASQAESQVRYSTGVWLGQRIVKPVEKRVREQVASYVAEAKVWLLITEPVHNQTQQQVVDQVCSRIRSSE